MNKADFVRTYVVEQPSRITVGSDWPKFQSDRSISLREKTLSLTEIAALHAPWHHKDGIFEPRIEEVLKDPSYRSVRLGEVLAYSHKLQEVMSRVHSRPSPLIPFPIASDTGARESLVLDGNNTLVFLLQHPTQMDERIPIVEILGENLERWFTDFHVIKRG